ncbi:nucleoside-diphosphate-sugar epimerase GsfE [Bipolaris maydis]|nr:nucleoside-diphosphate-sugar epimerase GsfE [Bipolaris maydis]
MAPKVALITGANGISGHALIEHLIRQPRSEWSKIVISSRSPLVSYWVDPRVEFVSIDFLSPVEDVIKRMKTLCYDVTHAFFTSYVHADNFKELKVLNTPLFRTFLVAIDTVAGQNLERHYGVHLGPVEVPCHEAISRYDNKGEDFYFEQEDILFKLQEGKKWTCNIIRPNAIIGFTPGKNGMSEALTAALYFLICREMNDSAAFPGNKFLADLTVFTMTHDNCQNEAFNHTNGDVFVWKYFWPKIGSYFGLDVPEPVFTRATGESQALENEFSMTEWAKDKKPIWDSICDKYGGKKEAFDWGTWWFFDWVVGKSWMSISSVNKARKYGWTRYDDTYETWIETYRSFENAGILPKIPKKV